jgi:hypothetical protein
VQVGTTAEKLKEVGVHTVGIVATNADRARLFFRFRPPRVPIGADPELDTHRAYGLPRSAITPEILAAVESKARELAQELKVEISPAGAYDTIGRLDGFTPAESDHAEMQKHQAQLTGLFLVDKNGVVRWNFIEAQRGLDSVTEFPTDNELLAAARAL